MRFASLAKAIPTGRREASLRDRWCMHYNVQPNLPLIGAVTPGLIPGARKTRATGAGQESGCRFADNRRKNASLEKVLADYVDMAYGRNADRQIDIVCCGAIRAYGS